MQVKAFLSDIEFVTTKVLCIIKCFFFGILCHYKVTALCIVSLMQVVKEMVTLAKLLLTMFIIPHECLYILIM